MHSELYKNLEFVNGLKESRQKYADEIIENPSLLSELIQICFSIQDKNSHKACWVLELVCYEKINWLQPYLDFICLNLDKLKNDSSIRPMSKLCLLLVMSHLKKSETKIILSEIQLQKITETCFDWMINKNKVASKVYSMRTLYLLGNLYDWIHPELKIILEKNYSHQSPAYKAVTKEVLKRMK